MTATAGVVKVAEMILTQCGRDIEGARTVVANPLPAERLPFAIQGNIVRGATVAKLWRAQGRQALAMHPEVVREVTRATSSTFPLDIFRAIPYLNPMVIFPEPVRIKSWRANREPEFMADYQELTTELQGYMLHGLLSDHRFPVGHSTAREAIQAVQDDVTLTHDPAALSIGMICFFNVLDGAGRRLDLETSSFSVPLYGQSNLKNLITEQVDRFRFATTRDIRDVEGENPNQALYARGPEPENSDRAKWLRNVYRVVLGTMLYLCSTTLDAELAPPSATKRLKGTMARQPLSLYRVGWTTGTALTAYRQSQALDADGVSEARGPQDPQHRRAHFRMQWYGPRNAPACQQMRGTCPCSGRHREWIFISPYWTHAEQLGLTGLNTVRSVPPQNR